MADKKVQIPQKYRNVELQTSQGTVVVELYWNEAPMTCYNFRQLASNHYYDGLIFHRVIRNFMVQGGDPTGSGRGGRSIWGEKFQDEVTPLLKHTGAGILSMANSGPNTNGSQFFITLAPTPWLDGKHTIFGRVKKGMQAVQRMGLMETGKDDVPKERLVIYKAAPCE
eukprot:g69103.t1